MVSAMSNKIIVLWCSLIGIPVVAAAALVMWAGLYVVFFDSDTVVTAKMLWKGRSSTPVSLADIFGKQELYCAIGPYDSFMDIRFKRYLSDSKRAELDKTMRTEFRGPQHGHQFIVTGISDGNIKLLYRSLFLSYYVANGHREKSGDCFGSESVATISFFDRRVSID